MGRIKVCNLEQFYKIMSDEDRDFDVIIRDDNKNVMFREDDGKVVAIYDANLNPPKNIIKK